MKSREEQLTWAKQRALTTLRAGSEKSSVKGRAR
jgi:hypothetical protein